MDPQLPPPHFVRASVLSAIALLVAVGVLASTPPLWAVVLASVAGLTTLVLTAGFIAAERQWRRGVDTRVVPEA